jgi:D-sedoheptulose 7-phosphate isomerase
VSTDATRSLYPFLHAAAGDEEAVVTEVARSTVDKAAEILALREEVLGREAGRLAACAVAMAAAFAGGGRLLAFGNGGSSTDAADVVHTFMQPPADRRRPLPAMSLAADVAVLTALSNDVGFDVVFARQVAAYGRAGDIAVGLSTSGGSVNVLRAFDEARHRGLLTVGFAGYDGGAMAESASIDHLFVVPSSSVHRIQEVQTTLYHVLWEATQSALSARSEAST